MQDSLLELLSAHCGFEIEYSHCILSRLHTDAASKLIKTHKNAINLFSLLFFLLSTKHTISIMRSAQEFKSLDVLSKSNETIPFYRHLLMICEINRRSKKAKTRNKHFGFCCNRPKKALETKKQMKEKNTLQQIFFLIRFIRSLKLVNKWRKFCWIWMRSNRSHTHYTDRGWFFALLHFGPYACRTILNRKRSYGMARKKKKKAEKKVTLGICLIEHQEWVSLTRSKEKQPGKSTHREKMNRFAHSRQHTHRLRTKLTH